jgi:hypothetical protein
MHPFSGRTDDVDMRYQGMTVGWAIALVVGTVVITLGSVRAVTGDGTALVAGGQAVSDAGPPGDRQPAGFVDRPLDMTAMRNVMVAQDRQPPAQMFRGPITIKQAAAEGVLGFPPALTFDPAVCGDYLSDVLGPLGELDGWVQAGSRVQQHHNNDFVQLVLTLPDRAGQPLINQIRRTLARCASGTVTLEGVVKGRVTNIEQGALNEPDAVCFAFTRKMSFEAPAGTREHDLVTGYTLPPDNRPLVNDELYHLTQTNIVGLGRTLIVVAEANLLTSNEIAKKMYDAARKSLVAR